MRSPSMRQLIRLLPRSVEVIDSQQVRYVGLLNVTVSAGSSQAVSRRFPRPSLWPGVSFRKVARPCVAGSAVVGCLPVPARQGVGRMVFLLGGGQIELFPDAVSQDGANALKFRPAQAAL